MLYRDLLKFDLFAPWRGSNPVPQASTFDHGQEKHRTTVWTHRFRVRDATYREREAVPLTKHIHRRFTLRNGLITAMAWPRSVGPRSISSYNVEYSDMKVYDFAMSSSQLVRYLR